MINKYVYFLLLLFLPPLKLYKVSSSVQVHFQFNSLFFFSFLIIILVFFILFILLLLLLFLHTLYTHCSPIVLYSFMYFFLFNVLKFPFCSAAALLCLCFGLPAFFFPWYLMCTFYTYSFRYREWDIFSVLSKTQPSRARNLLKLYFIQFFFLFIPDIYWNPISYIISAKKSITE